MPNRTFAFSHRGGYWKTRYSFFSNVYAYINKTLLSFRLTIGAAQRDPAWRHNIGPITSFYGTAGGSGFAVSFNQKPSSNKILKSISIEGTNNVNPASVVIANNSTTANQAKESPVIAYDDKGGILYGQIQGQNTNTNGNVKYMGALYPADINATVDNVPAAPGFITLFIEAPFIWADGGGSNIVGGGKYVFGLPTGPNTGLLVTNSLDDVSNTLTQNFGAVPGDVVFNSYFQDTGLARFQVSGPEGGITEIAAAMLAQPYVSVYSVTPNNAYGDMLKGQYADALFTCSANDWEIMSVNLEYEETTYDHSKAASMPSTSRGKRRRRR